MEIMTLQNYIYNLVEHYRSQGARSIEVVYHSDCAIGGGGVREDFLAEETVLMQTGYSTTQFDGTMPDSGVYNATVIGVSVIEKGKRKAVTKRHFFKWALLEKWECGYK